MAIFAVNFSSLLCVILTAINHVLNDSQIFSTYFSYLEIFCSNFTESRVLDLSLLAEIFMIVPVFN